MAACVRSTNLVAVVVSALLGLACGGGTDPGGADPAGSISRTSASPSSASPSSASPSSASPTQIQVRFGASADAMPNPERGWYGWSGTDFVQTDSDLDGAYASGQRLLFASVDLAAWRDSELSAQWLAQLSARLEAVNAAGMKVVLRFAYDWSQAGRDAGVSRIQGHLRQLQPVLASNVAAIAYVQAGFIGAWGEWHSSQNSLSYGYGSDPGVTAAVAAANRLLIRDALLAAIPQPLPLQVRYPADLMRWYPVSTQPQRRIGVHNDCFLSGPSDTGTYETASARDFTRAISEHLPIGGETCMGETPLRMACSDILGEGRAFHLSYLNAGYYMPFMARWRADGCGVEVDRSMGYRIELDALVHPTTAPRGGVVRFDVALRNVGWSRMHSARRLVVGLRHRVSGALLSGAAGDARDWPAQATTPTRISVDVILPANAQAGDYEVLISLPDIHARTAADPRFSVRFANVESAAAGQSYDPAAGHFISGTRLKVY